MENFLIAPSILAADFARLGEEVDRVIEAGADVVHFDVMDNHYVPNLTIGPMVCKALRDFGIKEFIDVHLMIDPVDELAQSFIEAGADLISFHPEASKHIHRSIHAIKEKGCKAGLVMDKVDLILLMSVNPGFGGQKFISSTLKKLSKVRALIEESGQVIRLEVDGGVGIKNIREIANAGADMFVAGSAIFGADDYSAVIEAMHSELGAAPSRHH